MKVTTQIPDELYRQVKAKAARDGKAVREVTEALYRAYLTEPDEPTALDGLDEWLTKARELIERSGRDGPTCSRLIEEGRNRLDRE